MSNHEGHIPTCDVFCTCGHIPSAHKKNKSTLFFLKPKIKPIHFRLIGGSVSSFATSGEICMAVFMFDLLV